MFCFYRWGVIVPFGPEETSIVIAFTIRTYRTVRPIVFLNAVCPSSQFCLKVIMLNLNWRVELVKAANQREIVSDGGEVILFWTLAHLPSPSSPSTFWSNKRLKKTTQFSMISELAEHVQTKYKQCHRVFEFWIWVKVEEHVVQLNNVFEKRPRSQIHFLLNPLEILH